MPENDSVKITSLVISIGEDKQSFDFGSVNELVSVVIKLSDGSEITVTGDILVKKPDDSEMRISVGDVNMTTRKYLRMDDDRMKVMMSHSRGVQIGPNNMQANVFGKD